MRGRDFKFQCQLGFECEQMFSGTCRENDADTSIALANYIHSGNLIRQSSHRNLNFAVSE